MPKEGILRTPEDRFDNLPDYDFEPNYVDIKGLRIHYVDEGPKEANPVLLMHGEPSWSYLYRKMIPPLAKSGHRVVAPDLMGFGKSDKPSSTKDHSHQKHVDLMLEFVRRQELENITLFCQDWGGLIGLRVVGEDPERFDRIIAANTGLPSARGIKVMIGYPLFKLRIRRLRGITQEEFRKNTNLMTWVAYSQSVPELQIGDIVQSGTRTNLSPEVVKAYDAPFPDGSFKAGTRIMPYLVPSQLSENRKVWDNVLTRWKKPFLTAFSDKDPITRGGERYFQKMIPGAQNREHVTIKNAGHFLQEDKGEELAEVILNFCSEN
ncbi:MAG: haloalkane dehalogenase [Candidatus Thorarchaeota archaeon]